MLMMQMLSCRRPPPRTHLSNVPAFVQFGSSNAWQVPLGRTEQQGQDRALLSLIKMLELGSSSKWVRCLFRWKTPLALACPCVAG